MIFLYIIRHKLSSGYGMKIGFDKYDVLIVGSGVSGLYTALNLDPSLRVLMLSKNELTLCNSALAQGGVAAVLDKKSDSFALHIKDTMIAGGFTNNAEHLRILVERGPDEIERLLACGVDFDRDGRGGLDLHLEGGHSRHRIAHHSDSTGFAVVSALIERVKALPNVTILEFAHLVNLKKEKDHFLAQVVFGEGSVRQGQNLYFAAKSCVLATGGIGRMYEYTTNSKIATGDGIYFAMKLGAKIKNLSLIQFHPTAFADKERECFLVSEAVRGEGAILLNCNMERFMLKYEPERKELAPRDVVSGCILAEEKRTGSKQFWLDISSEESDLVRSKFPMICERVAQKGWDMTKEPIPIYPCQHYLMGGIDVNAQGETTLPGLYAAGECAHTGVHGGNRLASNSLLEALVFPRIVAERINELAVKIKNEANNSCSIVTADYPERGKKQKPKGVREEVRRIMQASYFIRPDYDACERNLPRLRELVEDLESTDYELTPDYAEARSIAALAHVIIAEVLANRKKD
jgi:L-aspartate oxidase